MDGEEFIIRTQPPIIIGQVVKGDELAIFFAGKRKMSDFYLYILKNGK